MKNIKKHIWIIIILAAIIGLGAYSNRPLVSYFDSPNIDAFSRLRVSNPVNLFSVQSQYTNNPLQMESGNTGTGVAPAWNSNSRMVALSCTAGSGTSYTQSFQYIPYQPSKSQFVAITFVAGAAVSGAVVDVGYFDAANGIIFEQNGTSGLQVIQRSSTSGSVVNTTATQSNWNLDKLDGTGKSGVNLDITKSQILVIDFQYLGMGRVRMGFDIGGQIYYFHEFANANTTLSVPYMQTGSLPVQMLVTATATGSTKTAYFKCAAVNSEGGFEISRGYHFSTGEGTVTAGNGTRTHLLSLRPKTTFGGVTNREFISMIDASMLVTGTNSVYYEIGIGATFSVAPTWTNVNTTHSGFEYGTGGTLATLPTIIESGYVSSSATNRESLSVSAINHYPLTLDRSGAQRDYGTLTLCVTGIGGTSAMRAVFNFEEIR